MKAQQRIENNNKIRTELKSLFNDPIKRAWIGNVDIKTYPSGYIHIHSSWAGISKDEYESIIKPWMKANGFKWDASGMNYPEFPHWGKQI